MAERRSARGLKNDHRVRIVPDPVQRAQKHAAGAIELPGGDPRQAAADPFVRDPHAEPGLGEHRHPGLKHLRAEMVVEGVGPQGHGSPHTLAVRASAPGPSKKADLCKAGQSAVRADPGNRRYDASW